MCSVCGCGIEEHSHGHEHDHGHDHDHGHEHGHGHDHAGDAPSAQRLIRIEQDILGHNNRLAGENRAVFAAKGVLAINLMSSPGSGKTTLLCRTIAEIKHPVAVIEGDQQTSFDAERILATGAPAFQVNTGKGCHLDAHMIGHALGHLAVPDDGVLFIENVGNLVCPAAFDLGEQAKVVILSVTEGEDKPLKYADMFATADLIVLNKVDLLPHLSFDVEKCLGYARRVNPDAPMIRVSASRGDGMGEWLDWIEQKRRDVLVARVADLEAKLAAARGKVGG